MTNREANTAHAEQQPEEVDGTIVTDATATVEELIARLGERVKALEDELAVRRLLAQWGPAADSYSSDMASDYAHSADVAASLWDDTAVYDAGPNVFKVHGPNGIVEVLNSERHSDVVQNGGGHLVGPPMIWVDGDHATALCYHQLVVQDPGAAPDALGRFDGETAFRIQKLSATRWDFARGPAGWKITHRVNRTLDGTPGEGRAVFAGGLQQMGSQAERAASRD